MMALNLNNILILAPLAGYTDLPFRSVVKEFGADLTVSEMISSHALAFKNKRTEKMLQKAPNESPYSVQVSGSTPQIMVQAIERLNLEKDIDIIDFNCGCPAPKVSHHGNGSGLLKNLPHLVAMLKLIREYSKTPYTSVKVRIGFDKKIPLEIAHALNDAPVDFVVVHGRTKIDGYKKECIDYDSIALMKKILNKPLVANGEIDCPQKAKEVLQHTGADGLMIGRAALAMPWIFAMIKECLHMDFVQEVGLRYQIALKHLEKMVEFYGQRGVIIYRKNLHHYSKGLEGASEFRDKVNRVDNQEEMCCLIEDFFKNFLR
ncbi:tRNA dihydrouridine synthase DusB [Helicobacter monodelphidis]|uniref:tRNA dihydrouridine synthase n=1 Tax=Helicobacter sp. 15-1451 TaxID=2004995 RepID=UPI000DCDEB21|nr:tRNA-dihydrouridine synthase [Helicobacter sp. 15-1451]RAX56632.1 tRNA dihydrouridine synthase DusB [Helicobacter sp. 15-1451]